MPYPLYQVDAFTRQPFHGNPAAVCLLTEPRDETWMMQVAAEMNLSETAFLHTEDDGWRLRWFTPKTEVSLCGHATLASAHVLFESGALPAGRTARFYTKSGLLTADQRGGWIALNFPARPLEAEAAPEGLLDALGQPPVTSVLRHKAIYVLELADAAAVRAVQPDFARLSALPLRALIVTARSDAPEYDFVSRYFGPWIGINEDPVTGSAHCALAPYWAAKLNKQSLTAYQASARGGVLRVQPLGERVEILGQAVTVLRATLVD